jgi:hypothetical protein
MGVIQRLKMRNQGVGGGERRNRMLEGGDSRTNAMRTCIVELFEDAFHGMIP